MVARLRDENTKTEYTPTHTHTRFWLFNTIALSELVSGYGHTYRLRAEPLRANIQDCQSLSLLDTFSLLAWKPTESSWPPQFSKDVQESVVWCHWGQRAGCDAYTARLPAVVQQKPAFVGFVPMQNCRETRNGSSTWLLEWWLFVKMAEIKLFYWCKYSDNIRIVRSSG